MHDEVRKGGYYPWLKFFFECGTEDEQEDRNHNGVIDSIDDTQDLIGELVRKGYDAETGIRYLEIEGGRHEVGPGRRRCRSSCCGDGGNRGEKPGRGTGGSYADGEPDKIKKPGSIEPGFYLERVCPVERTCLIEFVTDSELGLPAGALTGAGREVVR